MNNLHKIEIQLAKKNAEHSELCRLYFNSMPRFTPTYEINERFEKLAGEIAALRRLKDILEQEQDPIGYKARVEARVEAEKLRRANRTFLQKLFDL